MPYYTSGDAELSYEIVGAAGRGADLVLLHPTPVHNAFWFPASEGFSPNYRVILPDLRGHGKSHAGEGPITIRRLAEDIQRLLDMMGIERALFAGCSIGSHTLFELWRRIPRRIDAMAFCCGKPHPDSPANQQRREQWIAEIRAHGPDHYFEVMSETLLGKTARHRDPGKVIEARAMMQSMLPETVIAIQRALASRPDSLPTAATVTVPTCIIAGGEDQSSTPQEMKELAEAIRSSGYRSEFHLIPNAGHYAPWEQPEVVGSILGRFFDSVAAGDG